MSDIEVDAREARFERYRVALREVLLDVIDGENSTEDDCADDVAKEAMHLADAENAALTAERDTARANLARLAGDLEAQLHDANNTVRDLQARLQVRSPRSWRLWHVSR